MALSPRLGSILAIDATPIHGTPADPLRVGVLAYPGCFGVGTLAVHDLLLVANRVAGAAGRPSRSSRASSWPGPIVRSPPPGVS